MMIHDIYDGQNCSSYTRLRRCAVTHIENSKNHKKLILFSSTLTFRRCDGGWWIFGIFWNFVNLFNIVSLHSTATTASIRLHQTIHHSFSLSLQVHNGSFPRILPNTVVNSGLLSRIFAFPPGELYQLVTPGPDIVLFYRIWLGSPLSGRCMTVLVTVSVARYAV